MASELPVVIEEELLCCALCMRSFREPRVLPCLHTFCRICLETQLAKTWPSFTDHLNRINEENDDEVRNVPDESGISLSVSSASEQSSTTASISTNSSVRDSFSTTDGSGSSHRFDSKKDNIRPVSSQDDFCDADYEEPQLLREPDLDGYEEPVSTNGHIELSTLTPNENNSRRKANFYVHTDIIIVNGHPTPVINDTHGAQCPKDSLENEPPHKDCVKNQTSQQAPPEELPRNDQRSGEFRKTNAKSNHHPPIPQKPKGLVVPPLPPGVRIKRTPEKDAILAKKLKSPGSSPSPKYKLNENESANDESCFEEQAKVVSPPPPLFTRTLDNECAIVKPEVQKGKESPVNSSEGGESDTDISAQGNDEVSNALSEHKNVSRKISFPSEVPDSVPAIPSGLPELTHKVQDAPLSLSGVPPPLLDLPPPLPDVPPPLPDVPPPLPDVPPRVPDRPPPELPSRNIPPELPQRDIVVPCMNSKNPASSSSQTAPQNLPSLPLHPVPSAPSSHHHVPSAPKPEHKFPEPLQEEDEEGYYEECELYEEVGHGGPEFQVPIISPIIEAGGNEDDENFYYIAEPENEDNSKLKPHKQTLQEVSEKTSKKGKKDKSEIKDKNTEKSQKKGWLISNIFKRSSPSKKDKKGKNTEISIKRSASAPDTSCAILPDLPTPTPTTVVMSPYSPSPSLSRPLPTITNNEIELTPEGTPVLPPRNTPKTSTSRSPPPLPTKRSISLSPPSTAPIIPPTPTPSVASLPTISSTENPLASVVAAIPKAPFSAGNPSIVNRPDRSHHKETTPILQSQTEVRMNCPTCNAEFIVPSSGIRGLKVNSFALSLQDVVLSQSNEEKGCNNCDAATARFRCLDCRHYLCSGCRDAHNWLKITKSHRVMTLGELQSGRFQRELTQKQEIKCDVHTKKKVELMCLYCDKPICSECKLSGHFDHRVGHLEEAAERDRDLITSLITSVKDQTRLFQDTKQQLADYDTQCSDEKRELVECLANQRDAILTAVNDAFVDLVQEIETAYKHEATTVAGVQTQVEATMKHMNQNCMLAEQLLTHGKTEDVLIMSRLMKINLNNFSFAAPFELDTRSFVQYSPTGFSKPMLVQLFGRLAKRRSDIVKSRPVMQRLLEKSSNQASDECELLHTFRAKTLSDSMGCKPSGLSISNNDDIIIVDDTNKKVKVFAPNGILKMELKPTDEHAFIDPWDVTITSQGYLAVTDRGARKVKVFDSKGRFVYDFGPHLKSPWGIAANSKGHLIVTDILAKTVFVHDQHGNLQHQIECKGHSNLFVCPEYVQINHNDDIIVSDFIKHCITVFDAQGRFLFRYGTRGVAVHEFTTPCGIGVTKSGHILISDYGNKRIHQLTRDGQFVRFILNATQHGLQTPQTLSVNSQGHLVVVDGTSIRTYSFHHIPNEDDSDSDIDPIYEPLQFSNKLYDGAAVRFSRTISDSEA